MTYNFTFTDVDKRISEEVQSRLPKQMFDIHAHLYKRAHLHSPTDDWMSTGPAVAGADAWRNHLGRQVGTGRLNNGLFFAMPSLDLEMDQANDFLIEQVAQTPGSRGLLLIGPDTPVDRARKWLANPRMAGFKPYSFFGTAPAKYDCAPGSFIPDWAWEIADERNLFITLHVVKDRAMAARDNYQYVLEKCRRYANAKLILAHCGRSFHAPNARNGLAMIRGLDNVWFDTSAICEPGPFITVIREFGIKKLMWGSDFPVSEIRGRCVTIGDGFFWLQPETVSREPGNSGFSPTLIGLESVRALLEAADYLGLGMGELEQIFYNNAIELMGC